MSIVFITGSLGLIGFESTVYYLKNGYHVVGVDNDFRAKALKISSNYNQKYMYLQKHFSSRYIHNNFDIRNTIKLDSLIKKHSNNVTLIIHTAAQTSHDWSKEHPLIDYSINAFATIHLLEAYRKYAPKAIFIFTSTNKVYGNLVNSLPLKEHKTRYDLSKDNQYYYGIDEKMSLDQSTHSIFGVSKLSADLLVQEYSRYYGLKTCIFRLGVVTGPSQAGSIQQGFLSYLLGKAKKDKCIPIIGYKGKQVRDVIHVKDVVQAFDYFYKAPTKTNVFNLGGGRKNSVSLLEILEKMTQSYGNKVKTINIATPRQGDHKWWISDTNLFRRHYPTWEATYSSDEIIKDIYEHLI
ncbi:MAG: NAD-dependent epimerase/dehydratase [Candidatus Roizmanbacteria bacterium GW2011_GWA2_37_7]|uniref:NAD-dependent epimerase/dehydratase n=1 Tax=Candidatus Roizmanbacteria bacterium GW2011_GWA2_37_7 TaxID=1618481 RepID=A0A0G0H8Q2_9BACT|nr:MAG: NAD-dependent epimerase/dehydratase [Candidatus Roizmanbacteria bacterium GW2011_GWA2_37_7]